MVIENLLGINIKYGKLYFNPCVPDSFDEYMVKLTYKKSRYRINVKNKFKKGNEKITIMLNGIKQKNNYIDLDGNDRDFIVEIEM